tara:strand:+ start:71 stop:1879 length:1809 start_codon:yes stop_codon:yes gene_type:complete
MANYNLGSGFTDTQDNQKYFSDKFVGSDPGPYVGIVKNTIDPLKMGRLGVLIPSISNVPATSKDSGKVIWCQYLSPFYGVKPFSSVAKDDAYSHTTSQSSYGMWAVPPDIETHVLVIFAQGDKQQSHAFWIGCVQEPLTNQMVPGMGASKASKLGKETVGPHDVKKATSGIKTSNYGTELLPIGEKNKNMYATGESIDAMALWHYPVNVDLANQLRTQGLVQDPVRGTTTSSARRESPSQVFGISTPGRIKTTSRTPNIGLEGIPVAVDRTIGHSFVMDDGDAGNENQLIRLRTASGHQLLMHDTEGVVYIANGSGKAFIEMEKDGTISVFSDAGINLRSGGDFNIHSDTNMQFHAKGSIKFTAEQNVNLNAEQFVHVIGETGVLTSSQSGTVQTYGSKGISSYSGGQQMHGASGNFYLQGTEVRFNDPMGPPGAGTSQWGPTWLKPEHENVGIIVTKGEEIDIDSKTPITVNGKINKTNNKTTVSDFVTHEPFNRTSSTALKKKYVNDAIKLIAKENPKLSASELGMIKSTLISQKSIDGITSKINNLTKLNSNVKLNISSLKTLTNQAKNIKETIKNKAMGFIQGKIDAGISAVRSFFRF